MSFSAKFYELIDDPRCLEKRLIDTGANKNFLASFNINFKQGHKLGDPTISIRSTSYTRLMERGQYVVITSGTTGVNDTRYYFCNNIECDPTGIYWYHCHLDVLMTYAGQLKALSVTLERSESDNNGYLPDSQYTALGYRAIVCKKFPQGLTTDSFVLMTTG